MKIILNQDVPNLGEEGDVVEVKDGYARNYLIPKHIAVVYNKTNEALLAGRKAAIEKRKEEKRRKAASLKERLTNSTITIAAPAGESGKLFGSITNAMIEEALAKQGIEIERKRIEVASHTIKNLGTYTVHIRLYQNEVAPLKVEVISESEMKSRQEKELSEKHSEDAPQGVPTEG